MTAEKEKEKEKENPLVIALLLILMAVGIYYHYEIRDAAQGITERGINSYLQHKVQQVQERNK
jgi:hypothetical protein